MEETGYFSIKKTAFLAAVDIIECLNKVKYLRLVLTCALISELLSNISTMHSGDTMVGIDEKCYS